MKGFSSFMHRFHRVIGMVAIIPVIFLIVTGLLLEFREPLELHDVYPENSVVLWLYGTDYYNDQYADHQGSEGSAGQAGIQGEFANHLDEGYAIEPASYERVLTAFHAGKFRGKDTRFLLVISAFTLLALSLTGPFIWLKRVFFKKSRNRKLQGSV